MTAMVQEQTNGSDPEESRDLVSGIAHDFNNLLMVIRGHSAILVKGLTGERLLKSALQIELAAERAVELTRKLDRHSRQQRSELPE